MSDLKSPHSLFLFPIPNLHVFSTEKNGNVKFFSRIFVKYKAIEVHFLTYPFSINKHF